MGPGGALRVLDGAGGGRLLLAASGPSTPPALRRAEDGRSWSTLLPVRLGEPAGATG